MRNLPGPLRIKRRLGDWSLRSRMLVLVLVPTIVIGPLVGVRVSSEYAALLTESHIHGQTLVAQRIAALTNALDDERDLTEVAFTGSGVAGDKQLAAAQRATSAQVSAFEASLRRNRDGIGALPPAIQQLGACAQARLADLGPLRAAAVRLGAGTPTFSAYTTISYYLLDFGNQLGAVSSDHTLGDLVSALASTEQIELRTSSERGYLVDVLSHGSFTLEQKENVEQAQFETSDEVLADNAPTSIRNLYQSTVSGDKVGTADGTIQAVATAAQEDTPLSSLGVSTTTAFDQMTDKLRAIRIVEQATVQEMTERSAHSLSSARESLYQSVSLLIAFIAISFFSALTIARSVVTPLRRLRLSALDIADNSLPEAVRRLHEEEPSSEPVRVRPVDVTTEDEVGQVARAFDRVHLEAVRLATEQARMRSNVNAIFTNLSRRSESLVLRQLQLIDELENTEQNPVQLASLFQLDHLATRMRRNNENLLVLAGEEQRRRWNQPVPLFDVVRASTAEVEQYERVVLYELPDVAVAGQAATDVVHLVAELIENATAFSGPETQVLIGAKMIAAGDVVLDIADAGIGIRPEELERINRRLAEPPVLDVATSRRMGLFVVGRLAAKYGIQVRLTSSNESGLNALVRIPPALLVCPNRMDGRADGFDQAEVGPGPQETHEFAGALSPAVLSPPAPHAPSALSAPVPSRQLGDPRFDGAYDAAAPSADGRRLGGAPAGRHSGRPEDDLPWFKDEVQARGHAGDDFSWFAEQLEEEAASAGADRTTPFAPGVPAQDSTASAPLYTYPGSEPGGYGSDRLPAFESTRSPWQEPDGHGTHRGRGAEAFGTDGFGSDAFGAEAFGADGPPDSHGIGSYGPGADAFGADDFGARAFGADTFGADTFGSDTFGAAGFGTPGSGGPQPDRHAERASDGWPDGGPQMRAAGHPTPSWARADDSAPAPAADGGRTGQGLPRRVPFGQPIAGHLPYDEPSQPGAAPAGSHSAHLMRDRLASFRQGVQRGKDGTDRDGHGPMPGGPGPL